MLSTTNQSFARPIQDICKEKDHPNFILNLTGVVRFPEYLLLIDNESMVFEVNKTNFANSYGHMQFTNITGVPLTTYFPHISECDHWMDLTSYRTFNHITTPKGDDLILIDGHKYGSI